MAEQVHEHVPERADGEQVAEQVPAARDLARAEVMAAYTRSLLEPLVARMAEQEETIRMLEREVGRLTAELAQATVSRPEPAPDPVLAPSLPPWWRRWWLLLAGAGLILLVSSASCQQPQSSPSLQPSPVALASGFRHTAMCELVRGYFDEFTRSEDPTTVDPRIWQYLDQAAGSTPINRG